MEFLLRLEDIFLCKTDITEFFYKKLSVDALYFFFYDDVYSLFPFLDNILSLILQYLCQSLKNLDDIILSIFA